jgi:hypothetical protein
MVTVPTGLPWRQAALSAVPPTIVAGVAQVMVGANLCAETQLLGPHTLQVVMRYAHLPQFHELAAVERLCKTGEGDEKEMTPAQDCSR